MGITKISNADGMARCTAAALMVITALFGQAGVSAGPKQEKKAEETRVTLLIAAAASLKNAFEKDLIPLFRQKYPHITIEGTYDSSGKLQAQIEAGLEADIFMSAAPAQMNGLVEKGLIARETVKPLLENKIVLIKTAGIDVPEVTGFETIANAGTVALGDPASVPAGQYAQEALTSLGVWDAAKAKASFGTNVTEVLAWVAEGSADVGVVYATDAASAAKVEVIAEAPEGSLKQKVLYPAGMAAGSAHKKEARLFLDFLGSPESFGVFKKYGFKPVSP
jgi:molybdate transport system substrate-binding protein